MTFWPVIVLFIRLFITCFIISNSSARPAPFNQFLPCLSCLSNVISIKENIFVCDSFPYTNLTSLYSATVHWLEPSFSVWPWLLGLYSMIKNDHRWQGNKEYSNMTSFKRFESKPVVKIILIYDRLNLWRHRQFISIFYQFLHIRIEIIHGSHMYILFLPRVGLYGSFLPLADARGKTSMASMNYFLTNPKLCIFPWSHL
jgi:hypothetical protein